MSDEVEITMISIELRQKEIINEYEQQLKDYEKRTLELIKEGRGL